MNKKFPFGFAKLAEEAEKEKNEPRFRVLYRGKSKKKRRMARLVEKYANARFGWSADLMMAVERGIVIAGSKEVLDILHRAIEAVKSFEDKNTVPWKVVLK